MELYYVPGACSLSIHITLEWIKNTYPYFSYIAHKVSHEEMKKSTYLELNPMGIVPTLTDGSLVISQNTAIMEYLNERFPKANLFGSEELIIKTETRKWLSVMTSDLHSKFGFFFKPQAYSTKPEVQEELQHKAAKSIQTILTILNKSLEENDFLSGGNRGVADAFLLVMLNWVDHLKINISSRNALDRVRNELTKDSAVLSAMRQEGLIS